jgi:hypothetical protein
MNTPAKTLGRDYRAPTAYFLSVPLALVVLTC